MDIAARRLTARIPVPVPLRERPLHEIGFDPTESLVVTNPDPVQGPCALSIDTGEVAWHFPDAYRADRWDTCFTWTYAPSGGPLAIGRRFDGAVDLRDPATREPWPVDLERPERHRVQRIAFSRDGRLMAAGGGSGPALGMRVASRSKWWQGGNHLDSGRRDQGKSEASARVTAWEKGSGPSDLLV
ncbi:hypothetical protein [Spirillospora sp. CA-128828]|uniref:hypothetical protein n=1 Tax=Spirillospora sp. CA-128828 TaxID=3240033 RepID=UPI003D90AD00